MLSISIPINTDSITSNTEELLNTMRTTVGPLADYTAPVALVVYDLLTAIGIPERDIKTALGDDYDAIAG